MSTVVGLVEAGRAGRAAAGGKAATLGVLAAAGLPVPDGFVVTAAAFDQPEGLDAAVAAAAGRLGEGPYAVRSSAVAEDTAEASFAGLYESYLKVGRDELPAAVRRCHASAAAARVAAYEPGRQGRSGGMAVLVQLMAPADAAGVAFTANPVTGDRGQVVVTAVRGLGERLVGGHAVGDEWVIDEGTVECRRDTEQAIDAGQARAVADLARRVEARLGGPQDIEWAIGVGRLALLQARPMTALPDPVGWPAPGPGLWLRNFRLGEWLPEPMTPLFADWLLPQLDEGFAAGVRATAGAGLDFPHAAVNGWYYTAAHPALTPQAVLTAVARSRGRLLWFLYHAILQPSWRPDAADKALLRHLERRWRSEVLPAYRQLVATGEAELATAPPARLAALVDAVGEAAGRHLWYLALIGGAAWKMEACLARFAQRHLPGALPDGVAVLLRGLHDPTATPPHAVSSIDWYHPTAGERTGVVSRAPDPGRRQQLVAERTTAERACARLLAGEPRAATRFAAVLGAAQRYAAIREEQARDLTLGWPLLRRLIARLGEQPAAEGLISDPDDAYFLTRAELTRPQGSLAAVVRTRRATWRRQRRLAAPLALGTATPLAQAILDRAGMPRASGHAAPAGAVAGQPASPGRATGRARILHDPGEADRLAPGDVLVAPATAPAWTPLFAIAAAVVTDGGTLAAHASLVAREYGIPAVVGTGDATARLHDGQMITVDGTAGLVTPAEA